jgi:5-methylcytosine-specific restriction endonuclease McrA
MTAAQWSGRLAVELTAQVLAVSRVCHLCGKPGADTADHLIPRKHGGTNSLDNLRPAHRSCNSARGAMPIEQWRQRFALAARPEPGLGQPW